MQRSIGVTVTAVAAALGAVLAFLFITLFAATLTAPLPESPAVSRAMLRVGQIGSMTMFGIVGVWAAVTAVGLWKLKPWSRWSVLVYAGLLIFVSLPAALFTTFLPMPPTPNVTEELMRTVRWGITGFYGALTLFAALLLYYFNRATVRAQFGGEAVESSWDRPLSITLIDPI